MTKNEGKLCLQCGQSLQADTCKNCKLLWGCKQLPPELEAFTSYAHNAELSPEKLAELESLLENFGTVAISMRSMQEAAQRGLSFVEPANEQRKRLKSLAEYNRRFVPQPPIIERSLPEITQAIKRAYQLAEKVLSLIGTIRYHKVELSTFKSMLAIPCLHEANDEERKQFIEEEMRLYQLRLKLADQIDAVGAQLKESGEEMRQAIKPLQELLMDILPNKIGKIDLDHRISGWHVFYPLDIHFAYSVSDWAFRHANALRYKVHYGNASHVEEWLQVPFPVSDQDHDKLFERIRTERSTLLSELKGYWELHHTEQRSGTTPQVDLSAIQTFVKDAIEQARENGTCEYPELLELRTEVQRLTVGCGRVWKAYRESQKQVKRSGRDWQVRMSEAYPAVQKLNPSLTIDDFEHYAKEGVKKNGRFKEWVHGSKGKKIPIQKFFA